MVHALGNGIGQRHGVVIRWGRMTLTFVFLFLCRGNINTCVSPGFVPMNGNGDQHGDSGADSPAPIAHWEQ